jgi:hypothetical protein
MADAPAFTKLVPGFDFLQDLVKNAGSALPNIGQWISPTLNPDELEKRIDELRTVQFWLEQNARMLGATIQALEVQRMTLSTLQTMNVQMDDLRDSLKIRMPGTDSTDEADKAETPLPPAKAAANTAAKKTTGSAKAGVGAQPVDPMQWWGALTKQFTELATAAMKDAAADASKNIATTAVKQSTDTAGKTTKKTVNASSTVARKSSTAASKRKSP